MRRCCWRSCACRRRGGALNTLSPLWRFKATRNVLKWNRERDDLKKELFSLHCWIRVFFEYIKSVLCEFRPCGDLESVFSIKSVIGSAQADFIILWFSKALWPLSVKKYSESIHLVLFEYLFKCNVFLVFIIGLNSDVQLCVYGLWQVIPHNSITLCWKTTQLQDCIMVI